VRSTSRLISGIIAVTTAAFPLTTLPTTAATATGPRLGGRILVLDDRPGHGLVSIRAAGGDTHRLHLQLPSHAYPDYSPDGTRVTYTDGWSVYTVNADGGDRRWVIDGGSVPSSPRWAPYGTEIGFEQGDITAATVAVPGHRQIFGSSGPFDWSPDGSQIAVVQSWMTGGEPWDPTYAHDVWIVSADGSQIARRLTDRAETWNPGRLAWSPNGRTLVVEASGDLWAIAVSDGATTNLTATADVTESSPIWSPNGRVLAYGRQDSDDAAPHVYLRPTRPRGAIGQPLGIAGEPTSWH
jgi:TolB protein